MSNTRYMAGGAVLFGTILYLWPKASPGIPGAPTAGVGVKTTGVQNIEKAYMRGGATSTHTKAYGGTIQGQTEDGPMREGGATGKPNGHDSAGHGEDQRPDAQTKVEKAWTKTMYGNEKGK